MASKSRFRFDVFLAHSSKDKHLVRALAERLREDGVKVWFDEFVLKPGDSIPIKIDEGLAQSRKILLCMSTNASHWADFEISTFRFPDPTNSKRRFMTLLLDNAKVKKPLAPFLYVDWRPENRERDYPKLLEACLPSSVTLGSLAKVTPHFKKETISQPTGIPCIGIIGRGFSGTVTAIRLMQLATVPIKLMLFEQERCQMHGGLAYGMSALGKEHYLNIHAGRISLYRERPDDFLKWATEDAKRSEWFEKLNIKNEERKEWEQKLTFTEFSAVPRLIYQLYLRDRFMSAAELAKDNVSIEEIYGCVHDIELAEDADYANIYFEEFDQQSGEGRNLKKSVSVDICVLSTGHMAPILPKSIKDNNALLKHHSFFRHPYDKQFNVAISNSKPEDNLLIIGSGLSAYDAAASAAAADFKGRITMCSRHGFRHNSYPQKHSHTILPHLCFDDLFQPQTPAEGATAKFIDDALDSAIERAKNYLFPKYFPDDHPSVIPERVLKAVETHIKEFVKNASPDEVKSFLEKKSKITTLRTSVVSEVPNLMKKARICYETKVIKDIAIRTETRLSVLLANPADGNTSEQEFTAVVCALGYDPDYSCLEDGLWGKVMKNYATPHVKTGLGIEVGNNGKLMLRQDGTRDLHVSRCLYTVGTMRQGDEMERNGRVGAFTFSIGTIRNQALMAAISILHKVELPDFRNIPQTVRRRNRFLYDLSKRPQDSDKFNELVLKISIALSLPNRPRRNQWLADLQRQVNDLVPRDRQSDIELPLASHDLWHFARKRAGLVITDIGRLSERYAQVRSYRAGEQSSCLKEKKDCKDFLITAMNILKADSVSLSVYSKEKKCLYPFVDHLRLNQYTPTPDGEGNAGRLIEAYKSGVNENELFTKYFKRGQIAPYYLNSKVVGMIIERYSDTPGKKENYKKNPRLYDHVLLALVLKDGEILGMIYLESTPERQFKVSDIKKVLGAMEELPELLFRVASLWEPHPDNDRQDQRLDDTSVRRGEKLWNTNFTNATMGRVAMVEVDLTASIFNGARCERGDFSKSILRGAKMVGAEMGVARFDGADLSGAMIYGSNFSYASLRSSVIGGAIVERSYFRKAVIENSMIAGTIIRDTDFSEASFKETTFIKVRFESCRLPQSIKNWSKCKFIECNFDEQTLRVLPNEIKRRILQDDQ